MKILMALDRRTFAGAPVDIVRKLRADAIHMPTRDADAYMRAVIKRLHAERRAEIELVGDTLDERCDSFLAGVIRAGMALPVFHKDHVDADAIRVLRRARSLTQEGLASLLGVSFATVNRWEAGEHLPASLSPIDKHLFGYFYAAVEATQAVPPLVAPGAESLAGSRERARQSFKRPNRSADPTSHNRHV